ncbi:4'-phosphopantetheinyl transferase superfamily protein [Pedobacter sp. B4-66]|uniref:4'-phosphopantetheinyl transferase family protein n=1 Tax=Pedobacter sp. B4-66 TaxID=2817280 RepID=UPI001BDAB0AA|nr:4'-phosphopantetheinyl transferase superfamily protein [Pedobacter sp. B4-66]
MELPKSFLDHEINWRDFPQHTSPQREAVHVFKINIQEYDRQYSSYYGDLLTHQEFQKATEFKNQNDAKRYLASKFVSKNILAHFVSTPASEIVFKQIANKKPYIDEIEFNISHSANYLLIAVSSVEVGIDIELVKPDFNTELLLEHCFDQGERNFINRQSSKAHGFYYAWTRKEAILKATGEGLTDHLNELNCLTNQMIRNGITYRLQTAILDENYVWTLATSNPLFKTFYWNYNLK